MDANSKLSALPIRVPEDLERRVRGLLARGRDLIDLGCSRALPGPELPAAFGSGGSKVRGEAALREAAARWYKRRHGLDLDPETEIVALAGARMGLGHLFQALVEPGELALVPEPGCPDYEAAALLAGARVEKIPLKASSGFLPELGELSKETAYQAKLLCLNYPHNPSGAAADAAFFQQAADWGVRHQVWLANDASQVELCSGAPHPSLLSAKGARDLAVEFNSLPDSLGPEGRGFGFAAGSLQALNALRRVLAVYGPGLPGAAAAEAAEALERSEELILARAAALEAARGRFLSGLKAAGWQPCATPATFFAWARPPQGSGSEACERLIEEASVLALPGSVFGATAAGFARFALVEPEPRLEEALRRIARLKWPARG